MIPAHTPDQNPDDELSGLRHALAEHERLAAEREDQMERYAADLRETFKQERARASELQASYTATVLALANAVEARDSYTGRHAGRVAAYGLALSEAYGLAQAGEPQLEFGYLLHDVGKVAVPDAILFKEDGLDDAEFALMARHTVIGAEILAGIDFLGEAKLVVRHHHERWDGEGYPDRLAGEQIPAAARIFAVGDALDALTSDRPYRRATSWSQARAEIARGAGTQFEPAAVAALDAVPDARLDELRRNAERRR